MDGMIMKNRSALGVRGSTTGASCNGFIIAPKTPAARAASGSAAHAHWLAVNRRSTAPACKTYGSAM
jgi:hypothetical protein